MTELKPCPFCGKTPKVLPSNPKLDGDAWGAVQCVNKKCPAMPRVEDRCKTERKHGDYKAVAIKRWNKRLEASHDKQ